MNILGISLSSLITIGVAVLVSLILLIIFSRTISKWIVKVPPDKALVVFGIGTKSRVEVLRKVPDPESSQAEDAYKIEKIPVSVDFKIVRGGAVLVIPLLHQYEWLDLGIMTLDVQVEDVLSSQAVPITVDGIAQIKIGGDMSYLATAAEQLLEKKGTDLEYIAGQTLMGHLRSIIGLMTVEETYRDREKFSQRVQEVAVEDMAGMGIEIKSFVIKDIDDRQGYIKALGAKEIQAKLRDERIAVAEANRAAREREAQQDLIAQTAELDRDRQVHEKTEATRLREVKKNQAIELAIQDKNKQVAKEEALAVEQKKQAELIIPSEAQAKAIKIEADGNRQKIEIIAEANAAAAKTKASGDAEATKLRAEADSQKISQIGEAEASAEKAKLTAIADGNRAQLLAEAEGKMKIAEAVAAEGKVNLVREIVLALAQADIDKATAFSEAIGGIGENIKIVQFAGNGSENQPNALMGILQGIPEMATMINAKTEALSGENLLDFLERALNTLRTADTIEENTDDSVE